MNDNLIDEDIQMEEQELLDEELEEDSEDEKNENLAKNPKENEEDKFIEIEGENTKNLQISSQKQPELLQKTTESNFFFLLVEIFFSSKDQQTSLTKEEFQSVLESKIKLTFGTMGAFPVTIVSYMKKQNQAILAVERKRFFQLNCSFFLSGDDSKRIELKRASPFLHSITRANSRDYFNNLFQG